VKNDWVERRRVCDLYAICGRLSVVFCYSNRRGKLLEVRLRRSISRRAFLPLTASTTLSRHAHHSLEIA
jgi:hypothetical protein